MAFFEKLTKWLKNAPPEASSPAPAGAPASAERPSRASAAEPAPAPTPGATLKDSFLQELRSIPTRHSAVEQARQELLSELKRIKPGDQP